MHINNPTPPHSDKDQGSTIKASRASNFVHQGIKVRIIKIKIFDRGRR